MVIIYKKQSQKYVHPERIKLTDCLINNTMVISFKTDDGRQLCRRIFLSKETILWIV